MWLLRNDNKGLIYRVTPGKQHIVSRKGGDLLLLEDQSISRKHAELFVDSENENYGVKLKDLDSKYGTFTIIGDGEQRKLGPNQLVMLKCGDTVRFGVQGNCWRAEFLPLVVATSTLTEDEKNEVKELVAGLGGKVVSEWEEHCTYLTMSKLTVTPKVVCALGAAQPIVMPAYWWSLTEALSSMQTTLPDSKDFLPPLAEAVLNPSSVSFAPNPERHKLFKGYWFVASTAKQFSRIKPMVLAAGGNANLFSPSTWSADKLAGDKVILLMQTTNEKQGSQGSQVVGGYTSMARLLRERGIRCIPEAEIGLSVLYCNMNQYCNPRYSARSLIGSSSSSLEATQPVTVFCPDSEESVDSNQNTTSVNGNISVSKKRPHEGLSEDESEEKPVSKKLDTHTNSEDLFQSQSINNTPMSIAKNSRKLSLTTKKTASPPNTSSSSISKEKKSPVNITPLQAAASSSVSKEKVKSTVNVGQSLDMFAPSGVISKTSKPQDQCEKMPSCQDLFASAESRQSQIKAPDKNVEFSSTKIKSTNKVQENGDGDIFSFPKKRINKSQQKISNEQDDFSFASDKKGSKSKQNAISDRDEFSFTSEINTKKRTRQSNPDMFASSVEPTPNCSSDRPTKLKKTENRDLFDFKENNRYDSKDSFSFPTDHKLKRKRQNESSLDSNDVGSEMKIALFSKKDETSGSSSLLPEREYVVPEQPSEPKNLITYSKLIPMPSEIKQEVNEEVDEQTKELQNATIVVVKPLVVARPRPAITADSTVITGKNFKKFKKVASLNKRAVPYIIGGCDLVPHNRLDEPIDDLLPPSPQHDSPDDDWGFGKKKKGKGKAY